MSGRNVKHLVVHGGEEMQGSMQRFKLCLLPLGKILKVFILHREDAGAHPDELPSLQTHLWSMWCPGGTMLISAGRVEPEFKMCLVVVASHWHPGASAPTQHLSS